MANNADPLSQLRDIHIPAPPPSEPVWDIALAALLIVLALVLLFISLLRRKRHWRHEALTTLSLIDTTRPEQATAEMASVVRRVAIQVSDEPVTALSGEPYLRRLDELFGSSFFLSGPGKVFGSALYQPPDTNADLQELKSSLASQIKRVRSK